MSTTTGMMVLKKELDGSNVKKGNSQTLKEMVHQQVLHSISFIRPDLQALLDCIPV
jgi:hypothetical protein